MLSASASQPLGLTAGVTGDVRPLSLRTLAPWLVLGSVLAFAVLYLVSAEPSSAVHEWMHDGRHLLGFPCH